MTRHYSTRDFFRQMPTGLLARYFRPQQVRILSVGIVRASDNSCNNAVKDERAGATAGLLQRRHKQPVAYTAAWRT